MTFLFLLLLVLAARHCFGFIGMISEPYGWDFGSWFRAH